MRSHIRIPNDMILIPAILLSVTALPVPSKAIFPGTSATPQDEPAVAPAPVTQTAIDSAIDRGLTFLLSKQELDGSWRFHTDRYRGGATGLCVYTLIKGGLEKKHHAVVRGLAFLDSVQPTLVYETATMLLAYTSIGSERHAGRIQELTDLLVDWNSGTWDYPGTHHDMSVTHYGALGLRQAMLAGAEVPAGLWKSLGKATKNWQQDDGSFAYHRAGKPTISMTAAGLGVACIVREALLASDGKPAATMRAMQASIDEGLAWLAENPAIPHAEWKGNETTRRWDYYYLYALQRVGALVPTRVIGGVDWYQAGARWLIQKQGAEGQWATAHGENQPNTSFAILFLRRASAPITGRVQAKKRVVRVEDPEADLTFVAAGQSPVRVWIQSIHQMHYDSWEWPDEEGKGLRVQKVEYLSDGKVLATVDVPLDKPLLKENFAAEIQFDQPGIHSLHVRVTLQPHPEEPDVIPIIESPVMEVPIEVGLSAWMEAYVADLQENLLQDVDVSASASSSLGAKWAPKFAIDGGQGHGWLCSEADEGPWLKLDFKKPIKANTILLSHARGEPGKNKEFARAQRIEVRINKRKPIQVDMNEDLQRKTIIELTKTERIRTIQFFLLDPLIGEAKKRSFGLMEVEMQLRKK